MGYLHNIINIQETIQEHNLDVFVETGLGSAESFTSYLKYPFKEFYSVEIHKETFDKFSPRVPLLPNVKIFNDTSENFLKKILPSIVNKPTLFWLDAHFPGTSVGNSYGAEKSKALRIPLEFELGVISKLKNIAQDIIIVDDLRIYIDMPFEGGVWADRESLGGNTIQFVFDMFNNTHNISISVKDQGYLVITPKK